MRGQSRDALAGGRERLESLLRSGGADAAQVGDDLLQVATVLAANAGLRRALTDPARTGEAKAGLAQRLLSAKVAEPTLDLLSGLVRARWSGSADLTEAVESLGVEAVLAAAEQAGRLDAVEDELFRFGRTVGGDGGLRDAFSTRASGADRKAELVHRLLDGKAAPETVRLAVQAGSAPRGGRTERVLEQYVEAAARRRSQRVAQVTAALPLTERQRDRLSAALERAFGHPVRLNIDLDPEVVGGLRVQVGDQVIDGTVLGRLDAARRLLAG
jgi:F-type H+-transporting ATPase subunit delta